MSSSDPGYLPAQVAQAVANIQQSFGSTLAGPFTVQDGGANPLLSFDTSKLAAPCFALVSDVGGCGPLGQPGPAAVVWTGSKWVRGSIARGQQVAKDSSADFTLDYWKDPMRVVLTGVTASNPKVTLSRCPDGAFYAITKPGLASAALAAFRIGLSGTPDVLSLVGPNMNLFEVIGGVLQQVQTV